MFSAALSFVWSRPGHLDGLFGRYDYIRSLVDSGLSAPCCFRLTPDMFSDIHFNIQTAAENGLIPCDEMGIINHGGPEYASFAASYFDKHVLPGLEDHGCDKLSCLLAAVSFYLSNLGAIEESNLSQTSYINSVVFRRLQDILHIDPGCMTARYALELVKDHDPISWSNTVRDFSDLGYAEAQFQLGLLYESMHDEQTAFSWYCEAAKNDSDAANIRLTQLNYERGDYLAACK